MEQNYQSLAAAYLDSHHSQQKGIVFLRADQTEKRLSYHAFDRNVRTMLGSLQQLGLGKGDPLIIALADEEQYITTLWACILGGIIFTPLPADEREDNAQRLIHVSNLLPGAPVLSAGAFYSFVSGRIGLTSGGSERLFHYNDLPRDGIDGTAADNHGIDEQIMLLFSSGSTGQPKGVPVSNRNILCSIPGSSRAIGVVETDRALSWLPLHHCFGLIIGHIANTIDGIEQVLMSTSLFSYDPSLWMDAASRHKSTILYSSNYGLKYLLDDFDRQEAEGWDLSAIKSLIIGAEMVSETYCDAMAETLEPYGFRKNALRVVYGMSEAVVMISLTLSLEEGGGHFYYRLDKRTIASGHPVELVSRDDRNCSVVACAGKVLPSYGARITDDDGNVLPDMTFGNLEICGDCVISGYYLNEEVNKESFTEDGWFKTGDTAFLDNGLLAIVGRKKDIIIVNGVNYYSTDLEQLVNRVENAKELKSVVCGVSSEESRLEQVAVFVIHTQSLETFAETAAKIKTQLFQNSGIPVAAVLPITEIPKSASGKIQRYRLAQQYAAGDFQETEQKLQALTKTYCGTETVPVDSIENSLIGIFSSIAGKNGVGLYAPFESLCLDSVTVIRVSKMIDQAYPGVISLSDLYGCSNISEIAGLVGRRTAAPKTVMERLPVELDSCTAELLAETAKANRVDLQAILFTLYVQAISLVKKQAGAAACYMTDLHALDIRLDFEENTSYMDLFEQIEERFRNECRGHGTNQEESAFGFLSSFADGETENPDRFQAVLCSRSGKNLSLELMYNPRTHSKRQAEEVMDTLLDLLEELIA